MIYNSISGTELACSHLSFGTSRLHHLFRTNERFRLLCTAYDLGITHFDTAASYAEGVCEIELGKLPNSIKSSTTVATKVGFPSSRLVMSNPSLLYPYMSVKRIASRFGISSNWSSPCFDSDFIKKSFLQSQRSLDRDVIDILFLHEPSIRHASVIENIATWLSKLQEQGSVRYLGLSGDVRSCAELSDLYPGLFNILQVEDNVEGRATSFLKSNGINPQFTFGYFRNSQSKKNNVDDIVLSSITANHHGSILFSTSKISHLEDVVRSYNLHTNS